MKPELENVVSSWINASKGIGVTPDSHNDRWSVDFLLEEVHVNPENAWIIIVSIADSLPNECELLSLLGAGPLEDLLVFQGSFYVDELISLSKTNENIRFAMRSVLLDDSEIDRYEEFYKVAGIEPPY